MSPSYRERFPDGSVAPYNFVTLFNSSISRYSSYDELPSHGEYKEDCLNGYIEYFIESKGPVIVSEGASDEKQDYNKVYSFFKNNEGKYTIPGSTIRGLIKSNIQILGLSSPADDIQDSLFLYRALADKNVKLQKEYTKSIKSTPMDKMPGKVKAGYIYRNSKDEYCILPAKDINNDGRTFYPIKETKLRRADRNNIGIKYMYNEKILKFRFNENADEESERKRWYSTLKDNETMGNGYRPYKLSISFDARFLENGGINLIEVNRPNSKLPYRGFILCSGFIRKKCSHYLVNEIDLESRPLTLDINDVRAYENDLAKKKYKKSDARYNYYQLPEKFGVENAKPVFYAEDEGRTYFGFTPYLRIFYKGKVKEDGIESSLKQGSLDYAKSMFGFIDKNFSYKSRLSFEDAVIINEAKELQERPLILSEPKPTCYPDYLVQTGTTRKNRITYNDKGRFRIRGIKQYWLKNSIINCELGKNTNVAVRVKPLDKGAIFKGRVYFNNLHRDELGLLVWALRLNRGCIQNIGLGKPYGYGKIQFNNLKLRIENLKKKYSTFDFSFMYEEENPSSYIGEYIKYVEDNFDGLKINNIRGIKEFFILKSTILKEDESRYMQISHPQFRNEFAERKALPTAFEIGEFKGSKYVNENAVIEEIGEKNENKVSVDSRCNEKQTNDRSGKHQKERRDEASDSPVDLSALSGKFNVRVTKKNRSR